MSQVFNSGGSTLSKTPISLSEGFLKSAAVNNTYFSAGEHKLSNRVATVGEGWVEQLDFFVQGYFTSLGVCLQSGTGAVRVVADDITIYQVAGFATAPAWETGMVIIHPGEALPFKRLKVFTKKESGGDDVVQLLYRQRYV
jgi:hypothetical protein